MDTIPEISTTGTISARRSLLRGVAIGFVTGSLMMAAMPASAVDLQNINLHTTPVIGHVLALTSDQNMMNLPVDVD